MSILVKLNNLESSTIYKLQFNGKIVGLRVKYFNLELNQFLYYDFELSYIKRQDLQDYLNKHSKDFEVLEMKQYNGVVCTENEIDGTIKVQEFKDEQSAGAILDSVIKVMEVLS